MRPARLVSAVAVGFLLMFAPATAWADTDCSDYATQQDAQEAYESTYGDPDYLDADGDGIACEWNPSGADSEGSNPFAPDGGSGEAYTNPSAPDGGSGEAYTNPFPPVDYGDGTPESASPAPTSTNDPDVARRLEKERAGTTVGVCLLGFMISLLVFAMTDKEDSGAVRLLAGVGLWGFGIVGVIAGTVADTL